MSDFAKDTNVLANDCISRQAAIDAVLNMNAEHRVSWLDAVIDELDALPSAQPDLSSYSDKLWRAAYEIGKAEARLRGRWVEVTDDGTRIWKVCDQCGEKPLWNEWRTDRCESNYCPNCGAKMDGGEQDG